MTVRCKICHRPLSDPFSVKKGMGPVCAGREGLQKEFGFMRAKVKVLEHVQGKQIFVRDIGHGTGRSVTNDADYVVGQLYLDFGITDGTRIFYEDSSGAVDEILHSGRHFRGFKAGHEGVELEA
jgi:hypothetical protein